MNREQENKLLKENGYRWELITQDWLDANDDFWTRPGWHLYAKGAREVTVAQALREIADGQDANTPHAGSVVRIGAHTVEIESTYTNKAGQLLVEVKDTGIWAGCHPTDRIYLATDVTLI